MIKYKQIQTGFIFIFLLFIVSWLYNYVGILFYPPYSIHAWRQADCLSFVLNFYKENLSFWETEINQSGDSIHGKTVSEFPIIYYTVAQLWKVFGQHESIFRLINISIVFFGLFNLHRLGKLILKDSFFPSPFHCFYSPLRYWPITPIIFWPMHPLLDWRFPAVIICTDTYHYQTIKQSGMRLLCSS